VNQNSDQRKDKRFKFETVILHDILLPDMFYEAKMHNISRGGVYFESDQILYPGEEVYIGLKSGPYSDDNEKYYSSVRIKWRKDQPNGSFRYGYGATFLDQSAALLKILDVVDMVTDNSKEPAMEIDPRTHQRQPYRKIVYFSSRNLKYKGYIKNISRGGAFILTREKFAIGQLIKVIFPATKIKKEVKLKGWVVRVDKNGIGVRFDRRSGKDRRSDLDRRKKIIDRRKSLQPGSRKVLKR
jgi:Tfp pilus assembly protein PilZ